MPQTITVKLPDDTLQRYQRGADAAHKPLEEFVTERLADAAPPFDEDLPAPLARALRELETLDDEALWQVVRSKLSSEKQARYDFLLEKNSRGTIGPEEEKELRELGEEARRLTLKKAHALMLLKWRGVEVPAPDEMPE